LQLDGSRLAGRWAGFWAASWHRWWGEHAAHHDAPIPRGVSSHMCGGNDAPSGRHRRDAAARIEPRGAPRVHVNHLKLLAGSPYLRSLVSLVVLMTLSEGLIDLVLKGRASLVYGGGGSLLRFFAAFYTGISLLTVVVQATVSRFALQRLGPARTAAFLPAGSGRRPSLGGVVTPGLPGAMVASATESVLSNWLYRAGYEVLFTPLPRVRNVRSRRSRMSAPPSSAASWRLPWPGRVMPRSRTRGIFYCDGRDRLGCSAGYRAGAGRRIQADARARGGVARGRAGSFGHLRRGHALRHAEDAGTDGSEPGHEAAGGRRYPHAARRRRGAVAPRVHDARRGGGIRSRCARVRDLASRAIDRVRRAERRRHRRDAPPTQCRPRVGRSGERRDRRVARGGTRGRGHSSSRACSTPRRTSPSAAASRSSWRSIEIRTPRWALSAG
jgi:hypothetical protein